MAISRIDQLTYAGIVDATHPLTAPAQALIGNLTDDEFHAILTVRAKIAPANQPTYDNTIRTMGF